MATFLIPLDPAFDAIGFDVATNESLILTTVATTNPVEGPAPITDHLRNDPDVFEFESLITNTPFGKVDFYGNGLLTSETLTPVGGGVPVRVDAWRVDASLDGPIPRDLISEQIARLRRYRDARILCDVACTHETLESMAMTGVAVVKGSAQAGLATIRITLQKIHVVSSATISEPRPKEPRGAPKKSAGKAAAKEPSIADQAKVELEKLKGGGGKSFLKGLVDRAAGGA